ncbi:uncharacterized protein QC761_0000250 [Podospora bellae-mahoneyi]|uniref:Uncharacterized protein n=1 Tax=Podospora bellae-mahoneyi TaxID=2093777 RepID=A0ABR0FTT4_9PEZI|nr:hypothetical protein QC761_0000250 [Podospora bellae-mahoneyi]
MWPLPATARPQPALPHLWFCPAFSPDNNQTPRLPHFSPRRCPQRHWRRFPHLVHRIRGHLHLPIQPHHRQPYKHCRPSLDLLRLRPPPLHHRGGPPHHPEKTPRRLRASPPLRQLGNSRPLLGGNLPPRHTRTVPRKIPPQPPGLLDLDPLDSSHNPPLVAPPQSNRHS